MSYTHRDNAQFGRARWRKTVLLPCWIAQVLLLLGVMGLFSYRLSMTAKEWKEEEDPDQAPTVEFVWESINIGFSLISLVITFVSIARFIAEVMTPLPLLFGNIMNLVLSSAVLALDIVVYVKYADRQYSLTGIAMDCALMFFTIIPMIYSAIIYRRLLSYDDYHIPGNVKPYGYASVEEPEETVYRSWLEPPVPYDPTNPSAVATRPRSLSATRRISLTLSSRAASPQPTPPPAPVPEHRASYDHKRDTQFDDYVRRRSSQYSKDDVDRALGVEFGWEDSRTRDSVVSSGTVPSAQARPRSDSFNTRQVSVEGSISRTGSSSTTTTSSNSSSTVTLETPEGMVRAHSLNSVPEVHEEEDGGHSLGKKKGKEVREALLGGDRMSRSSSGASRSSVRRIEPVEGLEEIELDSRKRRRES